MSTTKNRLGRGLGNLIASGGSAGEKKAAAPAPAPVAARPPSAPPAGTSSPGLTGFVEIAITSIAPGKHQRRKLFDPEAVREHARRVGMPADAITEVSDTVIVRPDPSLA